MMRDAIIRAEQLFSIYFRLERTNHCAHVTEYYKHLMH